MHDRKLVLSASLVALALVACEPLPPRSSDPSTVVAADSGDAESEGPVDEPGPVAPIHGGDRVDTCAWPSAVALWSDQRLCSGTLIHPELVVYAAHCGDAFQEVRFGEAIEGEGLQWVAEVDHCAVLPGGAPGNGEDFAYCRLSTPVDDVPVVPPLMGCELDVLEPGAWVTLVGFGRSLEGSGHKRAVVAELHGFTEVGEAVIGGDGADTCQGDSGGPAFVELPDGSWRVFGVTSWGGPCGDGGYHGVLPRAVPWLEEQTALDVSPCHDADGTWSPDARCDGLPRDPAEGYGTWFLGCTGGPVSGPGHSCGPAVGSPSCPGWCGEQAPDGCWCDDACIEHGDCCADVDATCPSASCEGWCGEQTPDGCWCDDGCPEYGDCCTDHLDRCG